MKILIAKRWKKLIAFSLVILLFTVIITPSVLEASEAECGRAYFKCMVTAVLLAIGNPGAGGTWGGFCSVGYIWCKEFMD